MDDRFNQAALKEFRTATIEIGKAKLIQDPLKKSFSRYEDLIATSIEDSDVKPACKAGCAYCCYYKVEVKAHEIFLIKDFMLTKLPKAVTSRVIEEADSNARFIKTLTPAEHLSTNIKCPFLIDSQCSIYSVRPFKCRNFHATDVDACEKSFHNPSDLTIASGYIESVALFGNAHSQAFEAAVTQSGLDGRSYDLNTALLEVFDSPSAIKKYTKRKRAFVSAIEVRED